MRPNHWTNDMRPQSLTIENRTISPIERPLLIAEVSANHDRDLDQALALVDIAADAGWDCLKLQTYTADTLTMRSNHQSCLLYTSPSPRDATLSRMPSSA